MYLFLSIDTNVSIYITSSHLMVLYQKKIADIFSAIISDNTTQLQQFAMDEMLY